MMKRRDNLEIVYLILKKCLENSTKTQISYSARINFKQVGTYLDRLKDRGLIRITRKGRYTLYKVTDDGRDLFNKLDEIFNLLT